MKHLENSIEISASVSALTKMGIAHSSEELSPLQEAYQKFFRGKLAEYGVDSPADLGDDRASEFFDDVKETWAIRRKSLNL